MGPYLFNILSKLRQVRDFVVQSGPMTLRRMAEINKRITEGLESAAAYIEAFGPMVQFTPGQGVQFAGGVDSATARSHLHELEKLREECLTLAAEDVAETQAQFSQQPAAVQMGLLGPDWRRNLLLMIAELIAKVLMKSGQTPAELPGVDPSDRPSAQRARRPKAE